MGKRWGGWNTWWGELRKGWSEVLELDCLRPRCQATVDLMNVDTFDELYRSEWIE
jgi:hypothetical protein